MASVEQRKQEWIDAKVAAGAKVVDATNAATLLERRGVFGAPERSSILNPSVNPADPAFAAMPDDKRTPAHRAAFNYASADPGGFTLEIERLRTARKAELERDQPEMSVAERKAEADAEAAEFRQFPGDRAGTMADASLSAPAGRLLFGYPTRLDKTETREEKRRQTAREITAELGESPGVLETIAAPYESVANLVGLDTSMRSMGELYDDSPVKRVIDGDDTSLSADEARTQGMDKDLDPDDDNLPLWRKAAGKVGQAMGGSAIETGLRYFGGDDFDLPEITSMQDIAEARESDADLQKVTSLEGMGNLAVRSAAISPFGDIGIDINEAIGTIDPGMATKLRDQFRDSRTSPAFDAVAEVADDAEVMERFGGLRPSDIPAALDVKVPPIAQVKRALEERPELRERPGFDAFYRYAQEGRSDEQLTTALRGVSFADLREVDPSAGASVAEIRAADAVRKRARTDTGGEASAAAERLMASAMLKKEGDRYVPSTIANAMRLAGVGEEMVVEADVRPFTAPMAAALATALGAPEETVRMLDELRIPTKAGLDTMLATGAYDGLLAQFGMGNYQPRYSPDEQIPYWARVLTNVTLADEQGFGYQDTARRAGLGVGSTADTWLGALDIAADFAIPFEEMVGAPVIGVGRVAMRASNAAKLAPAGSRLRAAFAGAMPSTSLALEAEDVAKIRRGTEAYATLDRRLAADVKAGKITEAEADRRRSFAQTSPDVAAYERLDAEISGRGGTIEEYAAAVPKPQQDWLTAVQRSVGLAARSAVRQGSDPLKILPSSVRSQVPDVIRSAGGDPDAVIAAAQEWSARARPMYLDTVGEMLAAGGTPDQVALRATPEYARVRSEVEEYVRARNLSSREVDAQMALLEVAAHVDAGINFGTPEEFFGRLNYRSGGDAGRGALFEGGEDVQGSIQSTTRPLAPTYYSALRRAVEKMKGEKFGADQLRASLRNTPGVKADEIEWTGLDRLLEGKKSVTKAEVLEWLEGNGVRVEERVLGMRPERIRFNAANDAAVAEFRAAGMRERDANEAVLDLVRGYGEPKTEAQREAVAAYKAMPQDVDSTRPHYESYQLPGGQNYREILFKMPESDAGRPVGKQGDYAKSLREKYGDRWSDDWTPEEEAEFNRLGAADDAELDQWGRDKANRQYRAPHFGGEGVDLLAHARVNDRVGPNGERILFVEEVQSDWHQAGREKGYRGLSEQEQARKAELDAKPMREWSDADTDWYNDVVNDRQRDGVPNAPFAKTWPDLVTKRLLRMAAEGNYDGIAWTPGIVQVKRYEDATRAAVDEIRYVRRENKAAGLDAAAAEARANAIRSEGDRLAADDPRMLELEEELAPLDEQIGTPVAGPTRVDVVGFKNGREVYRDSMAPEKLPDVLGKEIARKIVESPDADGSLTGTDLTVGGEGMKGFYDRMLPNIVQGLAKKFGGRVGETTIGTADAPDATAWAPRRNEAAFEMFDAKSWDELGPTERAAVDSYLNIPKPPGAITAPYLPLTPQLREAVLFDGQPLFMRDRTGSIEPNNAPDLTNATDYLIRLYKTGDMQTLLHEHGHLLRFVFGNDWMDGLMRHFDNDGSRLTVKGEEQAAEALRWYLRTRMQPNGRLRAKLDDVSVMLQNAWLRLRREPDLVPPALAAQWDDTLRPDQPVRAAAVSVVERNLTDTFPEVDLAPTATEQIAQDAVRRAGQRREAQRVSTVPDNVRQALGLRNSQTSANALDLYTNAVAYVAAEQLRKGWGLDDGVRLTTRTIVPKARAGAVADTVRARVGLALGADPSTLKVNDAGEITLTPAQRAGYDALVQEAADSPMGSRLPREVIDGTAPVTPENYNAVVETLIDHHAGPGARRSRAAEDVPQTVGYAMVRALRDSAINPLQMNKIREAFVVPKIGEGYIDPGVREVLESAGRELGEVHQWVYKTAQKAKAGDVAGTLQGVRAQLVPPVAPPSVADLSRLRGTLTDPAGVLPADVFAAVPDIQTALTAGVTRLSDNEMGSLVALRQLEAGGFDPLDPGQAALYADAVERLTDGLNRRWALVEDDASKILLAAAGSNDATILNQLTRDQMAGAYNAFYSGDWERLFAFTANLGHDTGMADFRATRFRPGLAVLEMLARLRGNEVMRTMAERLMRVGVGGTSDAVTANRALGDAPMGGRSEFLDRVQHYVTAETDWKSTIVNNPDAKGIKVGPPVPEGGEDLEAYTVAHRLLAQWGFKYGKGNEWVRRTLPSGDELLLPKMISEEIDAALDRVAKVGTAYGQAPAASARGASFSGEDIDLPIGVDPKTTAAQTLTDAVGTALRKLVGLAPATLAMTKIGITTGIGLPNPAYYVGNAFGGMLQMYAALGLRGTASALSEPRVTTALVARMFGEGKFKPKAKPIVARDGRVYTIDALEGMAQREGLSGSFVSAETAKGLARDIKRLHPGFWQRMMKVPSAWQRMLTETAQASDNFYRVATFVDALKKGESPASAAEMARKVGFDYSALTDFEKRYMRNTVMFYSFMRRNLDLFYDTLLTNPSRVLGQLRMLRGANEYFLGEESEIVTPSYVEGRFVTAIRSAAYQGNIAHNKDRVITIAPPLGVTDALNLHADVLDVLTDAMRLREGGTDAGLDLLGRLTPTLQIPIVLYMDKDPFTKRAVSSPSRVPANLVEWDRMMTGGIVVDNLLQVERAPVRDASNQEAQGQDEWRAKNSRAWWLYTHALQFPGAGRSLDTLAAMDRANIGLVEAAVDGARWANRKGLTPSDKEPGEGDTMEPRAGLTRAEELWGLFAVKPVRIDAREVAEDRLYFRRRQDLKRRTKEAEMGEPR